MLKQAEIAELQKWFTEYVHSFYSADPDVQEHILLKEQHTRQVVENSRDLSRQLGLDAPEQQLAELIGLFHDVGRFKQYSVYRTFVDSQSEDHAALGLKEIAGLTLLNGLSLKERQYFNFAIGCHNKIEIPPRAAAGQRLFAKIIRDADKLDVFRVLSAYLTPPVGDGVSPAILRDFLQGRQCNFTDVRTVDDRKLVRLSWIYDVNYSWTLRHIMDKNYVEQILTCLPDTPEIKQAENRLSSYIAAKL
ncbi:MAG: HD domain-containing protein [Veillonellales bacterium]